MSPARFQRHLHFLKRYRHVLPMDAFVQKLEDRTIPATAAAITFDDGYLDNLTVAASLLRDAGLPATLFVTTGTLGQPCPFWWDRLAHLTLGRVAAHDAEIRLAETSIPVRFEAVRDADCLKTGWRAWNPPVSGREKAYFDLWSFLRTLDSMRRQGAMITLHEALAHASSGRDDPTMSASQLLELNDLGCFQLGGHTRSHPPLTTISIEDRRQEIAGGRLDCAQFSPDEISGFAYPHGDLDPDTRQIVREAGFSWACTTQQSAVNPNAFDPYALPRIQALDVSPLRLWSQMKIAAMR